MLQQPTILIVEDEQSITDVIQYNLEREGFLVLSERDGQDGLRRARSVMPDVLILDLMLPGMDGLQVCRTLKGDSRTRRIPILMLTARSEETDEIVGFNLGADDYVTKPFRIGPLTHRIKALLRRSELDSQENDRISLHEVEVDRLHHTASAGGQQLDLTPTEFRLLWTMASQPGRPFSRNELMDTARGEDANALERTIDVHVRSLRRKLGQQANAIETVRGVGYRFQRQ